MYSATAISLKILVNNDVNNIFKILGNCVEQENLSNRKKTSLIFFSRINGV